VSPEIVGLIGIAALILLLFAGVWIGFAMAFLGFIGFAYLGGFNSALGIMATVPYSTIASYGVAVVPLFLLMGNIASNTGVSADLYKTAHRWLGHLPGGLAMATIGACAGFAAICGSSVAAAATIGKVVLPEMEKYKYDPKLATGSVAAGGTLGILIPPSLGFIIYGLLTQESIGKLFMAGVLPGVLLAAMFIIQIYVVARRKPDMGPPGPRVSFLEKLASLRFTWAMLLLFALVMGGIYTGLFTASEAGAIGAFGAIVITFISRKLTLKNLLASVLETGQTTAMVFVLLIGAMIFMKFLSITKLPFAVAEFVNALALPKYLLFLFIVVIYILIGMFMDILSALALTIPIIFPTVMAVGFNPIWFGVVMVVICEMGLVTPPVGMNVFIISGVSKVPLGTVFRGSLPFVVTMLICVAILTLFPQIALYLPNMMK
jgi:C4-dicarboxylate transporter, DctM subunit